MGEEGAFGRIGIDQAFILFAGNDAGFGRQPFDIRAHIVALLLPGKGAHTDAGIAHRHLRQPSGDGAFSGVLQRGGHEHAPDGGAFLPGFLRHLTHDFLDEDVKFGGVGRGVGTENGCFQAVMFAPDTRYDEGTDRAVLLDAIERGSQGQVHLTIESVQSMGTVEGDDGDASCYLRPRRRLFIHA